MARRPKALFLELSVALDIASGRHQCQYGYSCYAEHYHQFENAASRGFAAGTTVIHEKKDTDLRRISFFETPESYQPTFPQIAMLSDKDMAIVREVVREFEKNKEYKLLEPLSAKIKELTGIETHMNNLQFIQTILTDYIHLTK